MRAGSILIAVVTTVAAALASKPEVPLVWKLKLAPLTADPSLGTPDVLGLRFSPDGQWIAALTARISTEGDRTELLLVPKSGEAGSVRRFRIKGEALSNPRHTGLHWSTSGEYIAVEGKQLTTSIIRVAGGERCELLHTTVFGGFVGPDSAIAADWQAPKDPISMPADTSKLTIYGPDCAPRRTFKIPGQVRAVEPSARAGLIALVLEQSGIRVVTPAGAAVASVPGTAASMLRFGEKGTVVCKADYTTGGTLVCYELASGERFAKPPVTGNAPFDVSLDSSIVLAAQGAYVYNPFDETAWRAIKSWVIWDYRAEKEIARVKYRRQRHDYAVSQAAVAPDGRNFVLSGGGELSMYEIPAQ